MPIETTLAANSIKNVKDYHHSSDGIALSLHTPRWHVQKGTPTKRLGRGHPKGTMSLLDPQRHSRGLAPPMTFKELESAANLLQVVADHCWSADCAHEVPLRAANTWGK
eukprot:6428027-Amphidinium_carterae.5